jgi:hypothetical protein
MCFSRWNLNMWHACVFFSLTLEYETGMCFTLWDSNMCLILHSPIEKKEHSNHTLKSHREKHICVTFKNQCLAHIKILQIKHMCDSYYTWWSYNKIPQSETHVGLIPYSFSLTLEYETGMCFTLWDSNMWQSCVVWITHVFLSVRPYS